MLTMCLVVALTAAGPVQNKRPVQAPAQASAQAPATASAIPIYPGAEKYDQVPPDPSEPVRERLLGLPDGWPRATNSATTYYAAVTSDKVAAYYVGALRSTPSSFDAWKAIDPRLLAPGQSTAIHYLRYWAAGNTQHLYHWYRRDQTGDVVLLELAFATSMDPRSSYRGGPVTEINVRMRTYSKDIVVASPTEKDLGAPVYPGAVYDSNDSLATRGGMVTHCFLTSDPVDRVVAFYEAKLGKKAMKGDPPAGGVTWAFLSYSPKWEDDRVIIQEEKGKGSAYRTRIDFTLVRFE